MRKTFLEDRNPVTRISGTTGRGRVVYVAQCQQLAEDDSAYWRTRQQNPQKACTVGSVGKYFKYTLLKLLLKVGLENFYFT